MSSYFPTALISALVRKAGGTVELSLDEIEDAEHYWIQTDRYEDGRTIRLRTRDNRPRPTIRVVREAFTHTYGHGGKIDVPAGARTLDMSETRGDRHTHRWVDPLTYPPGSMDRHDAEHYGIRVPISNTEEIELCPPTPNQN